VTDQSDLDLLELQIEALFTHDEAGPIVRRAGVTFIASGWGGTMTDVGHETGATMVAPSSGMET